MALGSTQPLTEMITHSLCSSLNVRDQVSHPYETTVIIIVMYILNLILFGNETGRWTIVDRMVTVISVVQSALNFFRNAVFIARVPKYLNFAMLSKDLSPVFML